MPPKISEVMPPPEIVIDALPSETTVASEQTQDAHAYTLAESFSILRQALATHYDQADNMPAYLQTQETQMIFDNGNHAAGWKHLVLLLEQGLGVSLRQS